MAFDDLEISNWRGTPVSLYEFRRTSGDVDLYWRYNSSDRDFTYAGNVYVAVAISDDGVKQSGEAASSEFVVTMPVTEALPQMFQGSGSVPSDQVFLTLRRIHAGDTDARVMWVGTLSAISQTDEITAKITCATLATSFRRGGLRLSWTRGCPHVLYDSQCKMNPNDFKIEGIVLFLSGFEIIVGEFALQPDGWLAGGYIEWLLPSGATERRGIVYHTAVSINILGTTTGLAVGDTVKAFAGCRRIISVCNDKFSNLPNYGGFPGMPGKSPFDGDPVF